MDVVVFLIKFIAASCLFMGVMSGGLWLFAMIGGQRSTFRDALATIAGTHLGLLRFLFLAAIASFVLWCIYPGQPLFADLSRSPEPIRYFGYHLLWGNKAEYVPLPPPDYGSGFWGGAALLYIGLFAVYIVLGVPAILHAAMRAVSDRVGPPGDRRGAMPEFVLIATATFVGSVLAQMWSRRTSD